MSKLAAAFAHRIAGADSGAAVAATMAGTWLAIDKALRGVIGAQGMAALYARTIHVTARQHLWLLDTRAQQARELDTGSLVREMTRCSADEASAAAQALLQTFDQLFSSLIGPSLAEQLLLPVREGPWDAAPEEGRPS